MLFDTTVQLIWILPPTRNPLLRGLKKLGKAQGSLQLLESLMLAQPERKITIHIFLLFLTIYQHLTSLFKVLLILQIEIGKAIMV